MGDRELLELAAKAVGINLDRDSQNPRYRQATEILPEWIYWNPLTDDGDALRLMVKLSLTIKVMDDHVKVGWPGCVQWVGEECPACDRDHMPAATRRAIVRAAAEIGKAMP